MLACFCRCALPLSLCKKDLGQFTSGFNFLAERIFFRLTKAKHGPKRFERKCFVCSLNGERKRELHVADFLLLSSLFFLLLSSLFCMLSSFPSSTLTLIVVSLLCVVNNVVYDLIIIKKKKQTPYSPRRVRRRVPAIRSSLSCTSSAVLGRRLVQDLGTPGKDEVMKEKRWPGYGRAMQSKNFPGSSHGNGLLRICLEIFFHCKDQLSWQTMA